MPEHRWPKDCCDICWKFVRREFTSEFPCQSQYLGSVSRYKSVYPGSHKLAFEDHRTE